MTEYQRGYSKGYYTGSLRSNSALAAERARADAAARRAERAESATNIGHCVDCRHWRRGDHRHGWESCAWGMCHAGRQAGTPWGTYAIDSRGEPIQTSPMFGCVLFASSVADAVTCARIASSKPALDDLLERFGGWDVPEISGASAAPHGAEKE